jgi:thioredoxin-like negative regulator of GroEL
MKLLQIEQDGTVYSYVKGLPDKLLVIKFGATWNKGCISLQPLLEQLNGDYINSGLVVFAQVDVDKCGVSAGELGVRALPTTKLFKNGLQLSEVVGDSIHAIRAAVEAIIGHAAPQVPTQQ